MKPKTQTKTKVTTGVKVLVATIAGAAIIAAAGFGYVSYKRHWPKKPKIIKERVYPKPSIQQKDPNLIERTSPGYTPSYTPGYTVPGYTSPGYTSPGYTTPGYTTPGYTTPGYTVPGYTP